MLPLPNPICGGIIIVSKASSQAAAIRRDFERMAKLRHPDKQKELQEYVEEAEHQDSENYWVEYGPATALLDDFETYLREIADL